MIKGSGPTLLRKDGKLRGDRLDYAAERVWSTPRASDADKGGPNQTFGAGGTPLPAQVAQWSTPSIADTTGSWKTRSGERSAELLLNGQAEALINSIWPTLNGNCNNRGASEKSGDGLNTAACRFTHQDPEILMDGTASSESRRILNRLFVEWLMGWPIGWTAFACSETELTRFKQRMRFALSQLVSPPAAPPAQLALFG